MTAIQEPHLSLRDFKSFKKLIYDLAGIALADSKEVMVQSRLAKRLRALGLESYSDYWQLLSRGDRPDEITNFINALTTNKTDFFREKHHFDFLMSTAFPEIQKRAAEGGQKKVRIWCSASSTGEEPYTIAISVREFFGTDPNWDIRILASDIDTEVLRTAAAGVYPIDRFSVVPHQIIKRYFEHDTEAGDSIYRAKSTLRDLITFRQINLQQAEWPINTSFDVIFCRNVMIYFDAQTQSALVDHFSKVLRSDGYLMIGHSESLLSHTDRFRSLGNTVYAVRNNPVAEKPPAKPVVANHLAKPKCDRPRQSATPIQANGQRVPITSVPRSEDSQSIIVGDVFASREPIWISTTLGSCIGVCLYDEDAVVGGMNHFRLPEPNSKSDHCPTFGVHAMEMLINAIMKEGGDRRRLKAKVFGGAALNRSSHRQSHIGERNVEFIEQFLEAEGIPIISRYTGGPTGMQVRFHTQTAKAFVKLLDQTTSKRVEREESQHAAKVASSLVQTADVTLF